MGEQRDGHSLSALKIETFCCVLQRNGATRAYRVPRRQANRKWLGRGIYLLAQNKINIRWCHTVSHHALPNRQIAKIPVYDHVQGGGWVL
eukprot:SAG31_NODE_3285_length_4464_cov_2.238259_2_plen_90_part_00